MKRLRKADLIRALKLSPPALYKHLGKDNAPKADKLGRYSLAEVRRFIQAERDASGGGGSPAVRAALVEKMRLEAAILRLREGELSGELVNREQHERTLFELSLTVRQNVISMAQSIPPLLAGRTADECRDILTRAILDCCRVLPA